VLRIHPRALSFAQLQFCAWARLRLRLLVCVCVRACVCELHIWLLPLDAVRARERGIAVSQSFAFLATAFFTFLFFFFLWLILEFRQVAWKTGLGSFVVRSLLFYSTPFLLVSLLRGIRRHFELPVLILCRLVFSYIFNFSRFTLFQRFFLPQLLSYANLNLSVEIK